MDRIQAFFERQRLQRLALLTQKSQGYTKLATRMFTLMVVLAGFLLVTLQQNQDVIANQQKMVEKELAEQIYGPVCLTLVENELAPVVDTISYTLPVLGTTVPVKRLYFYGPIFFLIISAVFWMAAARGEQTQRKLCMTFGAHVREIAPAAIHTMDLGSPRATVIWRFTCELFPIIFLAILAGILSAQLGILGKQGWFVAVWFAVPITAYTFIYRLPLWFERTLGTFLSACFLFYLGVATIYKSTVGPIWRLDPILLIGIYPYFAYALEMLIWGRASFFIILHLAGEALWIPLFYLLERKDKRTLGERYKEIFAKLKMTFTAPAGGLIGYYRDRVRFIEKGYS